MKMTRKFIPALVMLLVSAIMLSTASFAWFASNNDVVAQNMQVKANSDAQFLQIASTEGGSYSDSANADEAAAEVDLVHAVISGTTIKWYTGESNDPGSSTAAEELEELEGGVTAQYALICDYFVKVSDGSAGNLTNLTVTGVTVTGNSSLSKALRVIIATESGVEMWSNTTGTMTRVGDTATVLLAEVTKTAKQVMVYAYYDGEDATAFTDNAAPDSLENLNITVSFNAVG